MKKTIIVLLALFLSGMVLIVGNASKPTLSNMLLPQRTPWYLPLVFSNSLVEGGIEIEGGVKIIRGNYSKPLDVDIEFWASSQDGDVTCMRACTSYSFRGCSVDDVYQLPWEPFVSHKTYTILNIGYDITRLEAHVQYLDNNGNLSRIISDNILIFSEPHPTITMSPTAIPTADPP